ncbi:hypothetical protein L6R50_00800 [Myxococcota bacterium]|nr:hypothetical protein [Myxococcota bacterium]
MRWIVVGAFVALLVVSWRAFRRRFDADREAPDLPRVGPAQEGGAVVGACAGAPGLRRHARAACAACGRGGCFERACPRCLVLPEAPSTCRHCGAPLTDSRPRLPGEPAGRRRTGRPD